MVSRVPKEESQRPHFGRSVDLTVIDAAIRGANRGYMRRLSDLSLETLRLDGHASACWQKRLNRLGALNWEIVKAEGELIEDQVAEDAAGMVRDQLKQISNFRQCLMMVNQGTFHGRAASEIDWYHYRNQWRVRDLNWIHARRLSFGPQRDLRVIDLNSEIGDFADVGFALECVPYKFVAYKPQMFGDYPEREGLAPRTVFWSFFGRFGVRERLHLLELFGKPWRIAMPKLDPQNPTGINDDQLDEAFDALNRLGGQSTAVMPIAMELLIAQPTKGAGDVHFDAIDHAEKTLSKLYLGGTATTDAVSTGLGSSVGDQHATEEDLIIASDAWRLSECIEDQLTDAIVIVNMGPDWSNHAPTFRFRTDPPTDRLKEGDRIAKALDVGLDVPIEEAREVLGVREARAGEAVLRRMPRNTGGALPFYSPLPEQVYPDGALPPPGTMLPLPTVPGAPPVQPPSGGGLPGMPPRPAPEPAPLATETPRTDVELSDDIPATDEAVERLAAKMTEFQVERCQHEKVNRCRLCGIERERDFELGDDGVPKWKILWRPIGKARAPAAVSELEEERLSAKPSSPSTPAAAAPPPSASRPSRARASAPPTTSRPAEPRQPSKRQALSRKRSRARSPA